MNRVWILVTWDEQTDHMGKDISLPMVRSYEDEHTAIEALKDALPIRTRANLFVCDETGGWGRVPGNW